MSPVEPARELRVFAKIWARVVSDNGLIYCELFYRPRLFSHVGYPMKILELYSHEQILVASTDGIAVVDLVDPDSLLQSGHDDLADQIQGEGWHGQLLDVVEVSPAFRNGELKQWSTFNNQ